MPARLRSLAVHLQQLVLIADQPSIAIQSVFNFSARKPRARMGRYCGQALKKEFSRGSPLCKQLVKHPKHAMILDLLYIRKAPKLGVAGEQNPAVYLGKSDRKSVGQR